MKTVKVEYYAILREQAGTDAEDVSTASPDARGLYEELRDRHGFTLAAQDLRVAIDDAFVDWSTPLEDGANVVFIAPVAGG